MKLITVSENIAIEASLIVAVTKGYGTQLAGNITVNIPFINVFLKDQPNILGISCKDKQEQQEIFEKLIEAKEESKNA